MTQTAFLVVVNNVKMYIKLTNFTSLRFQVKISLLSLNDADKPN